MENRHFESFEEYAEKVADLLAQTTGADIVIFPEVVTAGVMWMAFDPLKRDPDAPAVAELTRQYKELFGAHARASGQTILAGSHVEGVDGGLFNTAFLFHPDGRIDSHSKTHVFPTELESGSREGESLNVFEIEGITVGMAICYEMEFPEVATVLARKGAELILVPSYNNTEAAFYRVRHTSAARAIENQVFVVHAGGYGAADAPVGAGWARASVLTPCDTGFPADGVLAEAKENVEDIIFADLDFDLLREVRETGAARIIRDRERRMPLYRAYSMELLGSPMQPELIKL
jgi:predicted amidohydrolase